MVETPEHSQVESTTWPLVETTCPVGTEYTISRRRRLGGAGGWTFINALLSPSCQKLYNLLLNKNVSTQFMDIPISLYIGIRKLPLRTGGWYCASYYKWYYCNFQKAVTVGRHYCDANEKGEFTFGNWIEIHKLCVEFKFGWLIDWVVMSLKTCSTDTIL